jgi:hypothetical protein
MKLIKEFNIVILFSLIFCSFSASLLAQAAPLYVKAFRYIKGRYEGERIFVSDTIINTNFANFSKELSLEWGKNEYNTLKYLDSVDRKLAFFKEKTNAFNHLNANAKAPSKIFFFSKIFKDMIIVEVFKSKPHRAFTIASQASFNTSTQYLLIFDSRKHVKKCYQIEVQYD